MPGVGPTMREFASGDLHSGSPRGKVVTNPKQAIAIALNSARRAGQDVTPPPTPYGVGGPVGPPSYYATGGEVDDTMAAKPILPNTPSMQQPATAGYAMGGPVAPMPQGPMLPMPPAMPMAKPPMPAKAAPPAKAKGKPGKPLNRAQRVQKFEDENSDAEV